MALLATEQKGDYEDGDEPHISGLDGDDHQILVPLRNEIDIDHKERDVDEAVEIIENSKEPFWGNLIKKLYLDGFTVDQIQEAFTWANQSFKWTGQICIWFQESKPTCMEQLQFASGDGNPKYVRGVIQRLIEQNCTETEPEPESEPTQQEQPQLPQPINAQVNIAPVQSAQKQ